MNTETDQQRVCRLCSESADACRPILEGIPASEAREEMDFHSKFHHDIPSKIINIRNAIRVAELTLSAVGWDKVNALARRATFDLHNIFAAHAEEKHGWDLVGALTLIASTKSDELEIDEDRRNLERERES